MLPAADADSPPLLNIASRDFGQRSTAKVVHFFQTDKFMLVTTQT